jgi:hypothetical protein
MILTFPFQLSVGSRILGYMSEVLEPDASRPTGCRGIFLSLNAKPGLNEQTFAGMVCKENQ